MGNIEVKHNKRKSIFDQHQEKYRDVSPRITPDRFNTVKNKRILCENDISRDNIDTNRNKKMQKLN